MSLSGGGQNRTFRHDCGQEVIVVSWTHGYWRRPIEEESARGVTGAIPLKGDACICAEKITEAEGTLF